ncbi:MAG: HAD family hydrolase [Bacteroidetes bacterium]|nr:MAG: HAD family hydrolase [Bacteroidota bacterium]
MKRFSCVIFDLDGTLTQTNELIFASFNHVTKKYLGKEYTPDEITAMFGPPEEIALLRLVGQEYLDAAIEDFFQFYFLNHPRLASAHPGVHEILDYLKQQGTLLAVFTGKGKRSTIITLDALGIAHYFDLLVTGSDVINHKPSSEGIQKALAAFNIPASEALMVGDAVNDVKAARDAGVAMAAVLWDSYGKDAVMKMDVDYMFHSVKEFREWLPGALSTKESITFDQ